MIMKMKKVTIDSDKDEDDDNFGYQADCYSGGMTLTK